MAARASGEEVETSSCLTQSFWDRDWTGDSGKDCSFGPPSLLFYAFLILFPFTGLQWQAVQGITVWAQGHRTGNAQNGEAQPRKPQRSGAMVPKDAATTHWDWISLH